MTRSTGIRTAAALAAAGLVALSTQLPLWTMRMKAPQYPKGLRLDAYGSGMIGDLRELNIINHYIGMPPIDPKPPLETAAFPYAIALLVLLCLAAPLHRYLRRLAVVATLSMPVGILVDLQWWLYTFGHRLDPRAPIRMKPFTPLVFGTSTLGNFVTTSMISSGIVCLLAAGVLLVLANRIARRREAEGASPAAPGRAAIAACIGVTLAALPPSGAAQSGSLQARIDAAAPGSTVIVDGGVHRGAIVVRGPLTVVAKNGAVIDGGGQGSVVTIQGDDVTLRGFTVRNSGRQVTEEAAGIKASGNRHRIEYNHVHDVYFGIHIAAGDGHLVRENRIEPGERHGARPGHGISAWHVRDARVLRNRIADARDGIYLSFTEGVIAEGNTVTRCRYGMHSMYSQRVSFLDNTLTGNLLGSALMMSDTLVLRGNRIEQHREGTAAYGVLLKDIGTLDAEDNVIVANRVGVYAESVPTQPGAVAVFAGNVIAGNEVGLALQSNAALTVTGNRIIDNLTDVRPLGRQLSRQMRWSRDGRGNQWSQYRGYDANQDGIGDVPHRLEDAMDALIRRNPLTQAFLYTPAHLALEAAARMFPLYRQQPVLVDEHPLMAKKATPVAQPATPAAQRATPVAQPF